VVFASSCESEDLEPWHHHATLDPLFALNNKKKYSQPEHAFNEKI